MSKEKIVLGKKYQLDMGQHVTVIPKRVLTDGIECEYVMSWAGRKEIIQFDIWEMNGFDVSEIEVVGRLTEEELLQTQLGSRSGVDLEEYLVDNGIKGTIEEESTKEDFEAGFYYGSKSVVGKMREYLESPNIDKLLRDDLESIGYMSKQKKTYTEEDVIFMVNKMVEYYMFVTKVPIHMNLINGFLKDNFNFFKDEE